MHVFQQLPGIHQERLIPLQVLEQLLQNFRSEDDREHAARLDEVAEPQIRFYRGIGLGHPVISGCRLQGISIA